VILTLLRTRRWIGFTSVVLVSILAFGLLSMWQWDRAEQREAERAAMDAAMAEEPLAWSAASAQVAAGGDWVPVRLIGEYRPDEQAVVRKRPLEARNGFWVMTPLDTSDGTAWVNRGWIPTGGDALSTPVIPDPPSGEVIVEGVLRPFATADLARNEGLPAGQVTDPDPAVLPAIAALDGGYVQVLTSSPAQQDVRPLPLPETDGGRNLSYAVQWALFALVAIAGWFFFLRREARDSRDGSGAADADDLTSTSISRG
jgi:cytochrome oxidase assembly protein ShyY1